MEVLGDKHFKGAAMVPFIWPADKTETPAKPVVNGHRFEIKPNVKYLAATPIFEVMENSGFAVVRLPNPVSPAAQAEGGDGTGAPGGGGSGAGTFDAEAIIAGNVDEVASKLAGLTPDELALVKKAETDREQPRNGVLSAIEALEPPAA